MFTSFVKCLTKVSPLIVGRSLQKNNDKPLVVKEQNIVRPSIIFAGNKHFCRYLATKNKSNLDQKPKEGIDVPFSQRKSRYSIYNIDKWEATDVFIWAVKQRFSRKDSELLAKSSKEFVRWMRDELAWSDLVSTLDATNFTNIMRLKPRANRLKQKLIRAENETDGFPSLDESLSRDDAAHKYLTDVKLMEASLNQFKPISPLFGSDTKGYNREDKFFISKSRIDRWKKYYEAAQDPSVKLSWVPSGPHGIGKSGLGLMIAATAYFLKKPLFYYPNCRTTLTPAAIVETFFYWNRGLFESNFDLQEALDILLFGPDDSSLRRFWAAFTRIPGAVLILDEHNEFYKNPEYNPNSLYTSFQHFVNAQLVMFIGSAHSKFENNIPDGYKQSRFFLQPLTKEEMKHFVTAENSPVANLDWDKIPGTTEEEKFDMLYNTFGGVYRQVVELCQSLQTETSFEHESAKKAAEFYVQLTTTLKNLHRKEQPKFLTLMKSLQLSGSVNQALKEPAVSSVYDRGLLYVSAGDELTPVNGVAKDAIAFIEANEVELVLQGKTASENGARLEKAFINSFSMGEKVFSGYLLPPGKSSKLRNLEEVAQSHRVLATVKRRIPNTVWDMSDCSNPALILPQEDNHPHWDVIVKMPQEVYLFQVTIAESVHTLREKFNKFENFLLGKKLEQEQRGPRAIDQYAKNLYGNEATVEWDANGYWILVQEKKIKLHFILVHGLPMEQSKQHLSGIYPSNPAWNYLEILPREILSANFDIKF